MIVLTVKTLDSQNHTFTVDDDITVVDFKAKIADTVNIPADTQRIIYCGRVLQDDVKLSDYDVNGKVVHLVQRPPPSANAPSSNRSASPQPPRRGGFRTFEAGNTMYLGSMAFPSNLMESQGIVPPPPTHSLAGSRLNVARRMLRRAEAVINLLENPTARQNEQSNNEEQPEEEVTPIIEARVIVPSGGEEPIDEAMVLSAVQNSLFNATNSSMPVSAEVTVETSPASHSPTGTPPAEPSASTTPEEQLPEGEATAGAAAAPPDSSAEAGASSASNGDTRNGGVSARTLAENASRTTEMAQLLVNLNQLQERFAPFLERYRCFMIEDPVIPPENVRQTQLMLTRVSEVLHFLGHAYHSLSDIIIRVRTPPPRPLLCRPILIQHSAVVQAGIPIQVEVAQINLSAERPNAQTEQSTTATPSAETTTTTTTTATPGTEPSAPPAAAAAAAAPSGGGGAAPGQSETTAPPQPNVHHINIHSFSNNFPSFVPASSMRMQSFPIELRTALRNPNGSGAGTSARGAAPNNNNNNTATAAGENATPNATATTTSAGGAAPQPNAPQPPPGMGNFFGQSGSSDSPVEFFMEVSPDVLRGSMVSPPTSLMQSLMQIAGQFMTQQVNPPGGATGPAAPAASGGSSDGQQQPANSTQQGSQGNASASAVPGQNSQARGNTQTNPTTATHTRSTPRPHVHLAQQAMQGGFDPFLPCNSHHVTHRRRSGHHTVHHLHPTTATPPASASSQEGTPSDTPASSSPRSGRGGAAAGGTPAGGTATLQTLMEEIYNSLRTAYAPRRRNSEPGPPNTTGQPGQQQQQSGDSTSETVPPSATGAPPPSANQQGWTRIDGTSRIRLSPADFLGALNMNAAGAMPTLADLLQQIPTGEDQPAPGESIITDLIMLATRHVTIVDLVTITSGNYESLESIFPEVHSFVSQRILNGPNTPENVNRGVQVLIEELEPFLQGFSPLRTRENIDIVRTIERLFRRRLPEIVSGLATVNPTNIPVVVTNCVNLVKMIVGLCLYASASGQTGVENMFQNLIQSYMHGVPAELQAWTTFTSFSNLRFYINHNTYVESDYLPYIVRNDESTMLSRLPSQTDAARGEPMVAEPMEVDEESIEAVVVEAETEINLLQSQPPLSVGDVDEPLPNVVIGTEPWHAQVPENWVPIITRDVQRQRRQPPQRPYSDAYLSGMPTKKRKLVNGSKPQGSLPQVISDSVRRAVTQTGLSAAVPLETVAQAAGNSSEIQTAYRNLLRSSVQSALENDDDFTPERFPNASAYFKPPKP